VPRGGIAEDETVGRAVGEGCLVAIDHRVGQSAGIAHDRRRAVAQAVHLVQAARLEARGHQENVRAGLDQMRQAVVEADPYGKLSRDGAQPGLSRAASSPLSPVPSRTSCAGIIAISSPISSSRSSPFCCVMRQTAPSRGEEVFCRQAEALAQRGLVGLLALQMGEFVVPGQVGSVAGFQTFVSMPLRMPTKIIASPAQQSGEAVAESFRLDFLGISRADRGDAIRRSAGRPS
jgi:hypothetical protein